MIGRDFIVDNRYKLIVLPIGLLFASLYSFQNNSLSLDNFTILIFLSSLGLIAIAVLQANFFNFRREGVVLWTLIYVYILAGVLLPTVGIPILIIQTLR